MISRIGIGDGIRPTSVAVSPNGELYVTGWYTGEATFGTNHFQSSGFGEFFIVKCSGDGDILWARRSILPQSGSRSYAYSVAACPDGGAFVGGFFTSEALFGTNRLIGAGNEDIFTAKYSLDGELAWVRGGGGTAVDTATVVRAGIGGTSYVAGRFTGAVTLFGSNVTSEAFSDGFVAMLNADGLLDWLRHTGAADAPGLDCDASGNAYLLLRYPRSIDPAFGGGVVVKYRHDGIQLWVRSLGVNCCSGNTLSGIQVLTNDSFIIGYADGGHLGFTNVNGGVVLAQLEAPKPRLKIGRDLEDIVVTVPGWADLFTLETKQAEQDAWTPIFRAPAAIETSYAFRTNAAAANALFRLRR
ncbi:MAG TPA: hypothetical protein VK530_21500 [Candidatus Acidoferrum sp.]|nr:hypothetical protein [Candidatus Acidoferrum sp.]